MSQPSPDGVPRKYGAHTTRGRWLYIQSERGEYPLWTVGHYDPDTFGWIAESDHSSAEKAANRVHWLNGGHL